MKILMGILALVSFSSGMAGAWYWFLASKVNVSPGWMVESGGLETNIMAWVTGNMAAFTKSGDLNKRAAWLTAVAVASGSITNLLGFWR